MHPSGPLRLPSPRTPYERRLSLVRPSLVAVMPPGVAAKAPAFRLENATGHDRVGRCHVRSDLALSVPILCTSDPTFDCSLRLLLVRSVPLLVRPEPYLVDPSLVGSPRTLPARPRRPRVALRQPTVGRFGRFLTAALPARRADPASHRPDDAIPPTADQRTLPCRRPLIKSCNRNGRPRGRT